MKTPDYFPVLSLMHRTDDFNFAGRGGNYFAILQVGKGWLRDIGERDLWEAFTTEASSGDYRQLLVTMDKWFDMDLECSYDQFLQELEFDREMEND